MPSDEYARLMEESRQETRPSWSASPKKRTVKLADFVTSLEKEEPSKQVTPTNVQMAGRAVSDAMGDPRMQAALTAASVVPLVRPASTAIRTGAGALAGAGKGAQFAAGSEGRRQAARHANRARFEALPASPKTTGHGVVAAALPAAAAGSYAKGQEPDSTEVEGLIDSMAPSARDPRPVSHFKEYGEAAEAMGSMLNRIRTKQGKGIRLADPELAAVKNPEAVLSVLQEHGTLTSPEAKSAIRWIIEQE